MEVKRDWLACAGVHTIVNTSSVRTCGIHMHEAMSCLVRNSPGYWILCYHSKPPSLTEAGDDVIISSN